MAQRKSSKKKASRKKKSAKKRLGKVKRQPTSLPGHDRLYIGDKPQGNVYEPEVPTLCHVKGDSKTLHWTIGGIETECGLKHETCKDGYSLIFLKEPRGNDGILYPRRGEPTCTKCLSVKKAIPESVIRAAEAQTNARLKAQLSREAKRKRTTVAQVKATKEDTRALRAARDPQQIEKIIKTHSPKLVRDFSLFMMRNLRKQEWEVDEPLQRTKHYLIPWLIELRRDVGADEWAKAIATKRSTKR